jgi:hypothetical protein
VTVAFEGAASCTPTTDKPCTLTAVAHATDGDGDPLTYAWSGCATGTGARGTCAVSKEGDLIASVEVSDGHGHQARASATGHGNAPSRENVAPVVQVRFTGESSCSPMPTSACTVEVEATATDADGDTLEYSWDGCAKGASTRAVCTVSKPGPIRAVVTVDDRHGHEVVTWGTAVGANQAPMARIGYITIYSNRSIELLGAVNDPEEGPLCGDNSFYHYCVGATASGACGPQPVGVSCSNYCLGGLEVRGIKRTAEHGKCTVAIETQDSWGKHGTTKFTFDLDDPDVRHH